MKRTMTALASASLIALSGSAAAAPVELSNAHLDSVTAGATATFNFDTAAVGNFSTNSGARVRANANAAQNLPVAWTRLDAQSVALSVDGQGVGGAQAQTVGSMGASLP